MSTTDHVYMLDTNEFNRLLDGHILRTAYAGRRLLITGIQADELRATKDGNRREALLAVCRNVAPSVEPASSFALDIEGAGLDQASWNDGSGNIEKMLRRLQELDRKIRPLNQWRDVLIAETAIKRNAILVSQDRNLRQVVSEFGGQAIAQLPCAGGSDELIEPDAGPRLSCTDNGRHAMDDRTAQVSTKCVKCGSSIEIVQRWTAGGVNDYGGFVLECANCSTVFAYHLGRDIDMSHVVKGAKALDTYDDALGNKAEILKKHGLSE